MSLSILNKESNAVGMVSFDLIDWDKFRLLNGKENFLRYVNHTTDSIKQLPSACLAELQEDYYKRMLKKETERLFDGPPAPSFSRINRDEIVTYKSRKRGADNSLQLDRIMKASRPSEHCTKPLLNGVFYFKKGFFEESVIDVAGRNNCPKVNIPMYTIFYCMNLRQKKKTYTIM